jgi:cytochrome c oxidase subunit 2
VLLAASLAVGPLVACGGDDDAAEPPSTADLSPEALEGSTLARDLGCAACHSVDGGRSTGPGWAGLAGSEVQLEGGETVVADRAYLERAIVDPRSQVVAGYASIMPTTFELSDEEVDRLIAYIEALGGA